MALRTMTFCHFRAFSQFCVGITVSFFYFSHFICCSLIFSTSNALFNLLYLTCLASLRNILLSSIHCPLFTLECCNAFRPLACFQCWISRRIVKFVSKNTPFARILYWNQEGIMFGLSVCILIWYQLTPLHPSMNNNKCSVLHIFVLDFQVNDHRRPSYRLNHTVSSWSPLELTRLGNYQTRHIHLTPPEFPQFETCEYTETVEGVECRVLKFCMVDRR